MYFDKPTIVIVGGGIAGVTCAEQLSAECPDESILLISSSPLIKAASNVKQITRTLQQFDVQEKSCSTLETLCPNLKIIHSLAIGLNTKNNELYLEGNNTVTFKKLCLCTGAVPKVIVKDNPLVLGIRDTETVKVFQKKLTNARRIIVIGNGGIATEMVYEIENCQVIWAIKDDSVGATFFDPGAAQFFLPHLSQEKTQKDGIVKRTKYAVIENTHDSEHQGSIPGSALGPDWSSDISMKGKTSQKVHDVHVEYKCELKNIYTNADFMERNLQETKLESHWCSDNEKPWPIFVELSNGKIYGCDFIVSATGVIPNVQPFIEGNKFTIANDGGIIVDEQMRTSIPDIYAAGDVCSAGWKFAVHWFQMRLWTQARQMGAYAARCISAHLHGEEANLDFCFELFEHVTRFFGYKVVLLGLFNGQKLDNDYEIMLRVTKGEEYVKLIMKDGKMYGAILIGESNLEETFENLILNQMDLSHFGEELLNPNIDIEDYFD